MNSAKRNQAKNKVGKRRGVPVRAAAMIARKYALTHIVVLTYDSLGRSRLLYWARNDDMADQLAQFCMKMAKEMGWDTIGDFDCSSVRRMKDRIKELEAALAQIVDGCEDPKGVAAAAGKFPDETEGEKQPGAWLWFPNGKHNPNVISCPRCRGSIPTT